MSIRFGQGAPVRHLALSSLWVLLVGTLTTGVSAQVKQTRYVEELRIGDLGGGDYGLSGVAHVSIGSNGEIYVLQPEEHAISVFSKSGRFLRRIGRRGEGPGEMMRPLRLGWSAQTLWVTDLQLRRISYFRETDGAFLRSERLPPVAISPALAVVTVSAILPTREWIIEPQVLPAAVRNAKVRVPLLRYNPIHASVDTMAFLDAANRSLVVDGRAFGRSGRMYFRQPFDDGTLWDASPDGSAIIVVERSVAQHRGVVVKKMVFGGKESGFHWKYAFHGKRLSRGGTTKQIQEIADRVAATPLARGIPKTKLESVIAEQFYRPDYGVAIARVLAGLDGTTWLERSRGTGDEPVRWIILGERGNPIGEAVLPRDFHLMAASRGCVWGVVRDEWDVPYVVRMGAGGCSA